MVIQFEFENKKKKKFSGGGIFLNPYKERQSGDGMSIDEQKKLLLEALNAPTTNEPRSPRSSDSSAEVSGSGFVAVIL